MKAVDFAVSRLLPEDLRQDTYDLSKKGMANLLGAVASKYPDQFPTIAKQLGDLGRNAAWYQGFTTGADDTRKVIDTAKYYAQMDAELDKLRKEGLEPKEFDDARAEILTKYSDIIEKVTMQEAMKRRNGFALSVASGARGNAGHVKAILSTPGVFQDSKGRTIPMFVRNSFGDGVRPAETLAGTYGARTSVVSTKKATAKGGDLLKIMTQSTLNYNVTEPDCGVNNGIALDPASDFMTGRVLAKDTGGASAGTVIDRKLLGELRKQGKPIVARSALTCRAKHGICAKCAGVQSDGKFPPVGTSLGVTAAAAIGEPIVQGALNVKHGGGMAKGKRSFSGLAYISQFLQIPEDFKDRAAVAEKSGIVERIEEAPQGGTVITVDGEDHFALPGFATSVTVGQRVEAGDALSDGLINPADIVRLRGLGEGRKYYMERLSTMLRDSGQNPDARNVEILARAAVDTYLVEDPREDTPWNADDLVRESEFLAGYKKPDDTTDTSPDKATGKYLQAPALHYTVGTKLTPKMTQYLKDSGVDSVPVSRQEPWFKADMQRLRVASHDSKDWLAAMGTSYLGSQMRTALEAGHETDVESNYHYGPRLAFGKDFGKDIETTGKF